MTTDMEHELRELFRDKAGEAPVSTLGTSGAAPQQVLRRGRRRQVGTVLGSALVAALLAVGSFAGLRSLLRDTDPLQPGQEYEVFERTATIEAFTVTSPSDWFLVNHWPLSMQMAVGSGSASKECTVGVEPPVCTGEEETYVEPLPSGLTMFQLSNIDTGLASIACRDGLPDGAAVLYVALDYEGAIEGIADPSMRPWPGITAEGAGPCGTGTYTRFTVNDEPFFAWIGFGDGVSEADRSTVLAASGSLAVDDGWEPTPPSAVTPAYVIAGGPEGADGAWRLELRRDATAEKDAVDLSLEDGPAPTRLLTDGTAGPVTWTGTDPIFGVVAKGATGIEFRPGTVNEELDLGGSPVTGTILPVPPGLGPFDFDLFFIDPPAGYGELGGDVIALGVDAEQTVSSPPAAEPRTETVELSGTFEGHGWAVSFRGSFADGTACVYVDMDAERQAPLCPTEFRDSLAGGPPSMHGWLTSFHLLAGSVPPQVVELRFVGNDDAIVPQSFHCEMGPLGWTAPDRRVCALLLPPVGSGTVEYLDAAGALVSDEGIHWGTTEPEVPTPVEPVHGGTYWAVYPWVGGAASPEADDVSAQLMEEFGIEASSGDLSCDDGAAEALGTDAEQGIGVYFETEDEANAFADQAGLLGHEADPVIARVTTYCLD